MNKLLISIYLGSLIFGCSSIHKCNSNDNMEQIIIERQVHNFAEIPVELLSHIEKMGMDSSLILNEYEGKYLNFIFDLDDQDFNLVGKKVGFIRSKMNFFESERERFHHDSIDSGVAGTALYIFDSTQKTENGGYDAAIIYWSKFVIPIEKINERLKKEKNTIHKK